MADFFGKGIGVAAGFDLGAAAPLDTRTVVADMEELQGHIAGGRAYEGMMIYVEADAKMYIITKGDEGLGYEEFGFNQEKFDQGLEGVEGRLDALEAKDVELVEKNNAQDTRLAAIEEMMGLGGGEGDTSALEQFANDIAALKTAVGKEAEDEEPASGLVGDMAAVEGRLDALEAINHDTIEQLAQKGVDDAAAAKAAADAAQGEVDVLEGKVAVLEAIDHEAYKAADAQVLVDAKAHVAEEVAKLVEADNGIKGRLDVLEAIQHHDHENKEVLDGITAEKVAAWDGAEANAKAHAEQKIAELVGSAPEELNTLKELAEAINAHQDVYDTYVGTVTEALAGKVDKVEGSRLVTEEEAAGWSAKAEVSAVEAVQKAVTDGDAALQEQINALKGDGEGSVAEQIGAAKEELQGAIDGVQDSVDALEQVVGAPAVEGDEPQVATGLFAEIAALKAKDAELVTEDQRIVGLVEAAQSKADKGVEDAAAAQQAADKAQEEVDALEVVVGAPTKDGAEASGLFAEIAALKAKDVAIEEKNTSQDTRLAAIEEMMGLGGGEGDTSALEQFANDIAGLKSKVGAPAVEGEEPQPATGLFAEIAALKARDGELQGAVDAEAQRADAEEKRIVGLVEALGGRMNNAEEAIGQAQVDIQGLQDTINANTEADGVLKGRMDALEGVVGKAAVEGEEPQPATGLFAEIAAAKAAAAAAKADVDALEEVVGVKAQDEQVATGIFAEIDSLRNGVAGTFQTLKTEIKEDGMLYTNVGEVQVSATKVAVMDDTDVESVLGSIFGEEVVEG